MKALIILLILPLQILSQDLSGIWTGLIHTRGNDLSYELVINENIENLNGYSLMVFTINGIENIGVKSIVLKKKKRSISIEDDRLIYNNYSTPGQRIKLFGLLSLKLKDSTMILSGNFRTRSLDFRSSANNYTGTINLQKQKNSEKTRLISQLDTMNLLNTLSFIKWEAPEKEKSFIPTVLLGKSQPRLPEEKKTDSISLTPKEPSIVVTKSKENLTDSASKNLANKNLSVAVVETKIKETTNPVTSVKEPKQLSAKENKKQIDSISKKIPEKDVQSVVSTNSKKDTDPVTLEKEPKRLPLTKENKKQIDSISKKTPEKNEQTVAETKPNISQPVLIETTETPVTIDAAAAIVERKTEIIQNIFFRSDTLLLSLYDNGFIDGDTVSVVLNGKVIIAKQRLSEKALRIIIQMTPDLGDSLLLTMYAENLGSIPPNTGLLIIQDGEERIQIRFEGDTQKNSAIILRRKR